MKKKRVEAEAPVKTRKQGWWITVQMVSGIFVLNIYKNRILQCRHCINASTHEYATLKGSVWYTEKIDTAIMGRYSYYSSDSLRKRGRMSGEDEGLLRRAFEHTLPKWKQGAHVIELLDCVEADYGRNKREAAEMSRIKRVSAVMAKVPPVPEGIAGWIDERELGGMDYMLKDRETGLWSCSSCGQESGEKLIKTPCGAVPRDHDMVICPQCGRTAKILKRKKRMEVIAHFVVMQPIDDDMSVARHFRADICCIPGKKKEVGLYEEVRLILHKKNPFRHTPRCTLYYEQYCQPSPCPDGGYHRGSFDDRSNPANKREHVGYLYDGGIAEALKGTAYEEWARVFTAMAAAGAKADYNGLMAAGDANLVSITELLFKGRFFGLLKETSEDITIWNGVYCGPLSLSGDSIEDVFGIGDRQKINRIRDRDGGEDMLEWMRWSDRHHQKISDKALTWLLDRGLTTSNTRWMLVRFSPEQAMNYIERQRNESYQGKTAKQVISQYEDYMDMCEKLHKDTRDAMVYRPRELKRRHNEAVAQVERLNAQLKAEEYSKKFGEAEAVLHTIKEKFEYSGDGYFIKVPEKIVDIVAEGNYLHHCAGATDRYFDRIKQHETYICFLRKAEEPDVPFYTIEVEPGGTIRQHRGMYDEEPELEMVKPFLREWQKAIRKRMSKEDSERAAVSAKKREENIAELKAKNNTRVLQGLMEDFMEAVG